MNLDPIRIRELEASLEAHRLLLTNVSARAEDARGQLVRIGRELCGDEFDRFLGALGDLEYVSAEERDQRLEKPFIHKSGQWRKADQGPAKRN
jgi:hypothetical protein